jgi:hypothetical protein
MSRLTKKVKPRGKAPSGGRELSTPMDPRPTSFAGVVIDNQVYPLAGEPPRAVSRGWGDLSWLYWPRR